MGSIEVYDAQQQKWVPYTPDPEVLYQHLKDLRDGYVQPDHLGRYIVGSGARNRQLAEMNKLKQTPTVNLVSPIAQANEMAQSEVDREKKRKNYTAKKRKNDPAKSKQPRLEYLQDNAF
jgi:hypothetical protein